MLPSDNQLLLRGSSDGLNVWRERKELGQTPSCSVKLSGMIMRKVSKTVVGRCKGMDKAALD